MGGFVNISVRVNGRVVQTGVPTRESLADFLRHRLGLTGTNVGCEQGFCGACTVRLNGAVVRSCLTLACQVDGSEVETIEGFCASGKGDGLRAAFHANNAAQCGFCTPGMLLTAFELLSTNPLPDRAQIREFLSGNYCRCTGYQAIIDAIHQIALERNRGDPE